MARLVCHPLYSVLKTWKSLIQTDQDLTLHRPGNCYGENGQIENFDKSDTSEISEIFSPTSLTSSFSNFA